MSLEPLGCAEQGPRPHPHPDWAHGIEISAPYKQKPTPHLNNPLNGFHHQESDLHAGEARRTLCNGLQHVTM